MNDYITEITLDLNCKKTPVKINSAQFDKGRKLKVNITADGDEFEISNCTAVFKGVRPDKTHIAIDCKVDTDKVIVTFNDTDLSVKGLTIGKIVISDGIRTYSTQMCIIDVDSSLDGDITASDGYSILNRLIEQIHALNESGGILVDDELNEDSNNPIQNATVAKALFPILLDLSEIKSQTSTVKKNAEAGSKVTLEVTDKTWAKDSILRIAVTAEKTADEPVFADDGRMIAGVKFDGETEYTQVANSLITAEVIYIATADINTVAVTVPWEYVASKGEVTMTVESLGVRAEIADLKEKVSGLETDIENLRKETPIAKSPIEGKTFSILGDSISTFAGWIPEGQKAFYGDPEVDVENYVPSVTQMWWYILSSQLKMPLLANDSWMGTTMSTTGYKPKIKDENGNITEGPPADMSATAFPKRAESLFGKNNTTSIKPDYIFIFGGTNDYRAGSPVGTTMYRDWASGYTEDWTEENEKEALKSVLPSFCKLIHNTKLYNPHATIVNITFDELKDSAIGAGYAEACEQFGIINVVLENIEMPVDEKGTPKGHPAWEGQLSIAEQVIAKLREEDSSIKTYIDVSEVGL